MKLGGSVITDKTQYRALRQEVLERLAKEVASAPEPIVVIHGAGSFGHVVARTHRLADGDDGTPERRAAFARVLADVRELDAHVRTALLDGGIPAVSHATFDIARLRDGALETFDASGVVASLAAGFTPVLRGDGALDAARGFGIISGDVLMVELARVLRPSRAIFVTDVDGIYDDDPSTNPSARLLARVSAAAGIQGAGAAKGADVTGGMRGKLARAAEVARQGVEVWVINGLEAGRLSQALSGGNPVGTVVEP